MTLQIAHIEKPSYWKDGFPRFSQCEWCDKGLVHEFRDGQLWHWLGAGKGKFHDHEPCQNAPDGYKYIS